jgi:Zn-dependent protease with chaperone function
MEIPPALAPLFLADKPLPSRPTSFFYLLGLLLVTVAMVLLPVVYLGLTVLAGYGVYWFATTWFLEIWNWPGHGRGALLLKFICSFTPLLVGGCIALFMVKPFFARRAKPPQPYALAAGAEPLFHEFVRKICALVGAPVPREIRLDCEVNASAGFRRGLLSLFGSDLVLTVGMPLIAGLSARQLAGVIAHEFGHFTQGTGMRLSYLIRRVNLWFVRVIYERDSWDATLDGWRASSESWLSFMFLCAQAGVGFSRLLLRVLMLTGHGICSFLMRQMEYDADRCEITLAGSVAFEQTMLRMGELGTVTSRLYKEMHKTWKTSHRLPDNVPVLVAHHAADIGDDTRLEITAAMLAEKTGWFDTHPSSADRIAAAQRAAEPGIFSEDMPAQELLENFRPLSRIVTLAHYEDDLEIPTTEDFLIPVDAVLRPPAPEAPAAAPVPVKPIPQAPRWQGPPPASAE